MPKFPRQNNLCGVKRFERNRVAQSLDARGDFGGLVRIPTRRVRYRCIGVRHASRVVVRGGLRFHVRDAAGSTSVSMRALHTASNGAWLAGSYFVPKYNPSSTEPPAWTPTHVLSSRQTNRALCNTPLQCFKAARPRASERIAALRDDFARSRWWFRTERELEAYQSPSVLYQVVVGSWSDFGAPSRLPTCHPVRRTSRSMRQS